LFRLLLRKTKWQIWSWQHGCAKIQAHPQAKLRMDMGLAGVTGKIVVGKDSTLIVEEGVTINAQIFIEEGCKMVVRKGSVLKNVTFYVRDYSVVEIGEGAIFNSPERYPTYIMIDHGTLLLSEKTHLNCDISVRFGGEMTVGKYTGIGYGSEVRCEERVYIGAYGLFSYDVCIYDTNAHSADWRERRERIEKGYPKGASEETKPDTEPVWIGDDVWIGKGSTILKGSMIGHRCLVGIRTVVSGGTFGDDCIIVSDKPRVIAHRNGERINNHVRN